MNSSKFKECDKGGKGGEASYVYHLIDGTPDQFSLITSLELDIEAEPEDLCLFVRDSTYLTY